METSLLAVDQALYVSPDAVQKYFSYYLCDSKKYSKMFRPTIVDVTVTSHFRHEKSESTSFHMQGCREEILVGDENFAKISCLMIKIKGTSSIKRVLLCS